MSWSSSGAGRWSSSWRAENDRNKKVNEIVRAFVGFIVKERRCCHCLRQQVKAMERIEFEASNTTFEHEIVDVARSPGSSLRVFTSSERLANQLRSTRLEKLEIGEADRDECSENWKICEEERDG